MRRILPIIVMAQFFSTSLWFAGNSVIGDMIRELHLQPQFLAHITSAIQFGFIAGTFVFALFTIADRFSPSLVFFTSSILAAIFNLGITLNNMHAPEVLGFRFFTGFFLAGIYPVGMKIAADYYEAGLGKSLGFLVGALVIGTAFPHLLKTFISGFPWRYVLYATSTLSIAGGLLIFLFVPNGPYRKAGQEIKLTAFLKGFRHHNFRAVSFGYFGHMWELYTFWAFVPVMLAAYNKYNPKAGLNVSLLSFVIIGCGGLACVLAGIFSQQYGAKRIAAIALSLSGICCLMSPIFLRNSSPALLLIFLFFWGLVVIADSPLFSTLVAKHAATETRGTSLTIVNCIGFSITIISIQFINIISAYIGPQFIYMLLAIGPILGLIALLQNKTA
ncbi:MAG: MFS transporter [Sphingobacteriales bacterium]|nr:MFS transporter [Sphingobacteriales bacterium]